LRRLKKVVVIGPECTGKTDLSHFLAAHFKTRFVAEYAREYLDTLGHDYNQFDLTRIAQGQIRAEDQMAAQANQVLICDTDCIVVKVWSEFKYGSCDPSILQWIRERSYDLYLLTYIDIPWIADPLREHPDQREELWRIYEREVKSTRVPFVQIRGSRKARQQIAIDGINSLLSKAR
jgi:NadR type nicotinamide-nucleotide adenylyltransferase